MTTTPSQLRCAPDMLSCVWDCIQPTKACMMQKPGTNLLHWGLQSQEIAS